MQNRSDFFVMAHCDAHFDTEAVGVCHDCRRHACRPCSVQVRRIGILCTHCAMVRAGLRSRHAAVRY